jgi:hypothetical protein
MTRFIGLFPCIARVRSFFVEEAKLFPLVVARATPLYCLLNLVSRSLFIPVCTFAVIHD